MILIHSVDRFLHLNCFPILVLPQKVLPTRLSQQFPSRKPSELRPGRPRLWPQTAGRHPCGQRVRAAAQCHHSGADGDLEP